MSNQPKSNEQDTISKNILLLATIAVTLGMIVLFVFLIILSYKYTITSEKLKMDVTGQVGDFVGGVVGSLWALAGIFLFYSALRFQRKEFFLQRGELKNQRKEFKVNRITNLIYHQLNKI